MLEVAGIQISHLFVADVVNLIHGHGANLLGVGYPGSLGDPGSLLQKRGRGWAFGDKVKSSVVVDADHDRDGGSCIFLGPVIELLDELDQI